jgi:hypothetical protein
MKALAPLCLAALMTFLSAVVTANHVTTTETKERAKDYLLASCEALKVDHSTERTSSCRYYIYGFVDAGLVTGTINSEQHKEDDNQRSSFTERAYRTRVGPLDERAKTKATLVKPFCVPEEESRERVIGRLAKHLPDSMDTMKMLSTAIYRGLKTEYPCD